MVGISLKGKVITITGAAKGIGKAAAIKLAEAGADIAVSDIDFENVKAVAEEIKSFGVRSLAMKCNVSDPKEVNKMVDDTVRGLGKLDIMVNNAGVNYTKFFMLTTLEEFRRMIDINLIGVFNCCQAGLKYMYPKKEGNIINLSSLTGRQGMPLLSGYSATKFGIVGLTQSISREMANFNIRANCVCPGVVRTEMWENTLINMEKEVKFNRDTFWKNQIAQIPLKRPQTCDDIANAILFLASDLSKEITGQSLGINGGQITI
ncbi:MAG: SDR family oxidoreductase [Oscillospiraceae bacterium]|nr:SDR family oxidoreductase [Oscillospiraceae bacterium]